MLAILAQLRTTLKGHSCSRAPWEYIAAQPHPLPNTDFLPSIPQVFVPKALLHKHPTS